MTRLGSCLPLLHQFSFSVTLPLLLVLGLEVKSSLADVTSRLPPDEPLPPLRDTPSHSSTLTSLYPNVSIPTNAKDEANVTLSLNKDDDNILTNHSLNDQMTLLSLTTERPLASASLKHDTWRDNEPDSLNAIPEEEETAVLPNCRYEVKKGEASTADYAQAKTSDIYRWSHNDTNDDLPFSIGSNGSGDHFDTNSSKTRVRRQSSRVLHWPYWADKSTLFVELVAIGDYSFYEKYRGGATKRIMDAVAIANALFEPLGIVIVLVDIHLWHSGDQIYVDPVKEKALSNMKAYRPRMLKENPGKANDNVMLITRRLAEGNGGVAYTGGMCNEEQSINIVQDFDDEDAVIPGSILAHEMGHNFGMKHDGEGESFPRIRRCSGAKSIMEKYINYHTLNIQNPWSACGKMYLENMKKLIDLDCLKNVPTETYRETNCGNGIVEYGEQCDCGPAKFCKNPCCDADTCRLAPRATCASGACCDLSTCRPYPAGRKCRDSQGECDLPEYCSGMDETCPQDVYKMDGAYCSREQGHCYQGVCGSQSGRCRQLFGNYARVADQQCSQEFIHLEDRHGNCGAKPNQYLHCEKDSYSCGTLYCDAGGREVLKQSSWMTHHAGQKWTESGYLCQYILGFITHYPPKEWLSPDGTSCGNRKMCVNQKCRQVPGQDDSLDCPGGCSGRGVCNNRRNCHCNPGYAPPNCDRQGNGGSVDSGPLPPSDRDYDRPRATTPQIKRPETTKPYNNLPKPTIPRERRPRPTRPGYDRPRVTTPRYNRPLVPPARPTRPSYDRPQKTTPRYNRPWVPPTRPTRPWHDRPRTTTPRNRRPWVTRTPTTPHDKPGGDDNSSKSFLESPGMVAVWIILVMIMLLVVILILMCCFWDKIRRKWEVDGRTKVSAVSPRLALCIDNCYCQCISKAVHWMVSVGPLSKIQKSVPEKRRERKKSSGYRIDVEAKRTSQPDYLDADESYGNKHKLHHKPSGSPVSHHKPMEVVITRPKYQQSISVDSGCVIDDPDEEVLETPTTNVSMSSLVNAFRNYQSKPVKEATEKERRKSNIHDPHKEVSLRRLVTDPLGGHRSARQGLPQPYQKPPNSRHSISTDSSPGNKASKDQHHHKSHDDLAGSSRLANNPFILTNGRKAPENHSNQNSMNMPGIHIQNGCAKDGANKHQPKRPIMPPQRKAKTPPRSTPPREPPPLPPLKEAMKEVDDVRVLKGKGAGDPGRFKAMGNKKDMANGKQPQVPNSTLGQQQQHPLRNKAQNTAKANFGKTNVKEFPKNSSNNNGINDVPRVPRNRNVKNITQKFENL